MTVNVNNNNTQIKTQLAENQVLLEDVEIVMEIKLQMCFLWAVMETLSFIEADEQAGRGLSQPSFRGKLSLEYMHAFGLETLGKGHWLRNVNSSRTAMAAYLQCGVELRKIEKLTIIGYNQEFPLTDCLEWSDVHGKWVIKPTVDLKAKLASYHRNGIA